MKHQLFETWILSDELLSLQNRRQLQEHLQYCGSCDQLDRNWREVARFLPSVPEFTPLLGFADRWHERLVIQQQCLYRRQSLIMLAISASGAGILCMLLFRQISLEIRFLLQGLKEWANSLFGLISSFDVLHDLFGTLVRTLLGLIPLPLWIGVFGFISFMGLLWLISLRKLAYYQRLAQ